MFPYHDDSLTHFVVSLTSRNLHLCKKRQTNERNIDFHFLIKYFLFFFFFTLSHCVVVLPYFWACGWSPCRLQGEEPQPGPSCPLLWQLDRKCVCERPRFALRWDEHATAPDLCHPPRCHLVAGVGRRESQGQGQAGTCRAVKSTYRNLKLKRNWEQHGLELELWVCVRQ